MTQSNSLLEPSNADAQAPSVASSLDMFLAQVGPRAFRFAESGLRHREDALDVVQEAMIKMLNYAQRPPEEWVPLFWRILRTSIIDQHRKRSFRLRFWAEPTEREEDTLIDWADDAPGPVQTLQHEQAYSQLTEALRGLPARQREAFTLRVFEELDVATTAQVMGCSEGSVKTHLFRARAALQQQLEALQ